jgi:transcriptional regulator with XRE-family HTH domain
MIDMNKVARNIKNARTKKNMTQLELADIVGVSYQAVSNWERGNSMPDIGKITDIAKALDLDVSELLGDDSGSTVIKKVLDNKDESLTAEELKEVAPMLPPDEVKEKVKKISDEGTLNLHSLVEFAPFLDDDYLDEIADRVGTAQIKDLVALAPFLSDETLDEVITRMDAKDFEGVTALAPFLSDETLDKIVDMAIENGDVSKLTGTACYLGRKSLKKITEFLLKSDDSKTMSKFMMYM